MGSSRDLHHISTFPDPVAALSPATTSGRHAVFTIPPPRPPFAPRPLRNATCGPGPVHAAGTPTLALSRPAPGPFSSPIFMMGLLGWWGVASACARPILFSRPPSIPLYGRVLAEHRRTRAEVRFTSAGGGVGRELSTFPKSEFGKDGKTSSLACPAERRWPEGQSCSARLACESGEAASEVPSPAGGKDVSSTLKSRAEQDSPKGRVKDDERGGRPRQQGKTSTTGRHNPIPSRLDAATTEFDR